jgi:hypothetical protein
VFSLQLDFHPAMIASLISSIYKFMLINSLLDSGYADRIHELLDVSRELSGVRDKSLSQNSSAKNYISEANYIEFSGVKVSMMLGAYTDSYVCSIPRYK